MSKFSKVIAMVALAGFVFGSVACSSSKKKEETSAMDTMPEVNEDSFQDEPIQETAQEEFNTDSSVMDSDPSLGASSSGLGK